MVNEPQVGVRVGEFLDFLSAFMRYRRRMMSALPEDVACQKERILKLRMRDGTKRSIDNDLLPRVGAILSRHGKPMPMGELSKELDVPLSTATRIVDTLVDYGYAERVDDPEDRRVVLVTLSAEGRDSFQVISDYMHQQIAQILSPLTEEERTQLGCLLRKVIAAMDETGW